MLCRAELRGLGDVQEKLAAMGGTIFAISSDSVKDSKRSADALELAFDLLSDESTATIQNYGLLFHEPYHDKDVALPAHFLIDRDGKVAWKWVAQRVNDRPDPAVVVEQVDRLLKDA